MAYKAILRGSLTQFGDDDIEDVILGDRFDPKCDRAALGSGYQVLSYVELLEEARRRYRDLYDMLVPEGFSITAPPAIIDGEPEDDEMSETE
jgi:hypothetical protein